MARAILFILLTVAFVTTGTAQTNALYGYVNTFGLTPRTNVLMQLNLLSPINRTWNGLPISNDPIYSLQTTNGYFSFTNVLWGRYKLLASDGSGTSWTVTVPQPCTGYVPIASLIGNAMLPPNPATNYYTQSQVDALISTVGGGTGTTNLGLMIGTLTSLTNLPGGTVTNGGTGYTLGANVTGNLTGTATAATSATYAGIASNSPSGLPIMSAANYPSNAFIGRLVVQSGATNSVTVDATGTATVTISTNLGLNIFSLTNSPVPGQGLVFTANTNLQSVALATNLDQSVISAAVNAVTNSQSGVILGQDFQLNAAAPVLELILKQNFAGSGSTNIIAQTPSGISIYDGSGNPTPITATFIGNGSALTSLSGVVAPNSDAVLNSVTLSSGNVIINPDGSVDFPSAGPSGTFLSTNGDFSARSFGGVTEPVVFRPENLVPIGFQGQDYMFICTNSPLTFTNFAYVGGLSVASGKVICRIHNPAPTPVTWQTNAVNITWIGTKPTVVTNGFVSFLIVGSTNDIVASYVEGN